MSATGFMRLCASSRHFGETGKELAVALFYRFVGGEVRGGDLRFGAALFAFRTALRTTDRPAYNEIA
jgi:hypothetical protein